jgi:hypothetical protein
LTNPQLTNSSITDKTEILRQCPLLEVPLDDDDDDDDDDDTYIHTFIHTYISAYIHIHILIYTHVYKVQTVHGVPRADKSQQAKMF